jgi:hypothetical protein
MFYFIILGYFEGSHMLLTSNLQALASCIYENHEHKANRLKNKSEGSATPGIKE